MSLYVNDPPSSGGATPAAGLIATHICRVATTANHGLSGLAAIDGVTPVADDRILATTQTTVAENGIYVAASGAWTRATDFNETAEVLSGTAIIVTEGTIAAQSLWLMTTTGAITVGTTSIVFKRAFSLTGGATTGPSVMVRGDKDTGLFYDNAGVMYVITDGVVMIQNDASYNTLITRQLYFDGTLNNGINHGTHLRLKGTPDVQIGVDGAIATNATAGFLDIPSCAGAPSGTPTPGTGKVPIVIDTTNGRLYAYYGAAWHLVALV